MYPAKLSSSPEPSDVAVTGSAGSLTLTGGDAPGLLWRVAPGGREVQVALSSISKAQVSPAGKPEVKLRLLLQDGKSAYVFEFTDALHARAHREAVVEAHKQRAGGVAGAPPASVAPRAAAPTPTPPPSAGADFKGVRALRSALLASRPKLRAEYEDLVGAGVVSEADFWGSSSRLALVVDASLVRPAVGLSSRAPATQLRGGGRSGAGEEPGGGTLRVDQQMQLAVFKREPAVGEAFHAFVPALLAAKDFWGRYFRADADRLRRRQQLEDGSLGSGGAGGGGAAQRQPQAGEAPAQGSSSGGLGGDAASLLPPPRPISDVRGMRPEDFFDALRRGEFPPPPPRGHAVGGPRRRSALPALDSRFDLLSTVEDSAQAASLRGGGGVGGLSAGGRSGYGTSESGRAYDAHEEQEVGAFASGGSAQAASEARRETARRRERTSVAMVADINAYSATVVDCALSEGEAAVGGSRAGASARGGSGLPRAAEAAPSISSEKRALALFGGGGVGAASTMDDLPDLYAPAPPLSRLLPLRVDLSQLKALATAGDEAGAAAAAASGGGGGGSGYAAVGSSGSSSGGWSQLASTVTLGGAAVSATTPLLPGSDADGAPLAGGSSHEAAASRKRRREEESPAAAAACAPSAGLRASPSAPAQDPTSALEGLAGKPFLASARRVLRELTVRAHDLFESADRSARTGISLAVPPPWQAYVEERLRLNCELLALLWPTLTAARRDPRSAETRAKLLQRVHAEYRGLEALKLAVLAKGAHALLPPPNGGRGGLPAGTPAGGALEAEVFVPPTTEEEGRAATSDTVSLLNLLAAPLDTAIQRAESQARGSS